MSNFSEGHWTGNCAGAFALQASIYIVEDTVAREGRGILSIFRGGGESSQIVVNGGGKLVLRAWKYRGVQLHDTVIFVNALHAHINDAAVVVSAQRQAGVLLRTGHVLGKITGLPIN